MSLRNQFGQRLRELRKAAKLKQIKLAELSGIDPNLISRYERGDTVPTLETIKKIALSLGVNIDELLNEPIKQEFEVKIIMGVKNLPIAGLALENNKFFLGVDDDEAQITLGGKVGIKNQEEREKSLKKIIERFWEACWMYDHKEEAKAEIAAQIALSNA